MQDLVQNLFKTLKDRNLKIACAESCTGGLLSAALTSVAGSSVYFDRGFTTYSNESKTQMLGVPEVLINSKGAVSQEVAKAMAEGALKNSNADLAISITGIAGPDGGNAEKPVGTVYIGYAIKNKIFGADLYHFQGDRGSIRQQTVDQALLLLFKILEDL